MEKQQPTYPNFSHWLPGRWSYPSSSSYSPLLTFHVHDPGVRQHVTSRKVVTSPTDETGWADSPSLVFIFNFQSDNFQSSKWQLPILQNYRLFFLLFWKVFCQKKIRNIPLFFQVPTKNRTAPTQLHTSKDDKAHGCTKGYMMILGFIEDNIGHLYLILRFLPINPPISSIQKSKLQGKWPRMYKVSTHVCPIFPNSRIPSLIATFFSERIETSLTFAVPATLAGGYLLSSSACKLRHWTLFKVSISVTMSAGLKKGDFGRGMRFLSWICIILSNGG